MAIEEYVLDQVRSELDSVPYGCRGVFMKRWAATLGISKKSLYGYLSGRKGRKTGDRKIKGIEDHAAVIFRIKIKPPEQFGVLSTDQAIEIAVREGLVPEELRGKKSTIDRVIRDLGLQKKKRRYQRYQAARPNQVHHVDASTSNTFYPYKKLPNGDYELRVHTRKTKGYKSTPNPLGVRLWLYGMTDDHSGVVYANYIVATGESLMDNLMFLCRAWEESQEKEFFGVPEMLIADKGPLTRGKPGPEFFDRLNVDLYKSVPGNKEANGKIERAWRTVWQSFEKQFLIRRDLKNFSITLSELNEHFQNFQAEYNDKPHRYEKGISRIQAWRRINLNGGAVAIPENAISTAVSKKERTVGADGCFSIDGHSYEVKGLHDAKVWVFKGLFKDKMVVEDQATGKRYDVEDFKPNEIGEYTGHKLTPYQLAKAAADEMDLTTSLYATPKDPGNVVQMPARIRETLSVEDPLDTGVYRSMEEAMGDFISFSGYMPPREHRQMIETLILENRLSRRYVVDLAADVQHRLDKKCI